MTPNTENIEAPRRAEDEIDLEAVRQKLTQRVHEALDRRERGEDESAILNANDVLQLREIPPATLEHLVAEVVRDTIEARNQMPEAASEAMAETVTKAAMETEEIAAPLIIEEVEQFEHAAEDLSNIETYAAKIIQWHDEQAVRNEQEGGERNMSLQEASIETRIKGTEMTLDIMRTFFRGSDKYAIMASTALYLHSKNIEGRTGEKKFLDAVPPGDLDVFVYDSRDFAKITERISNLKLHPNVTDVRINGPQLLYGEGTRRLEAVITLDIDGELYEHEIEMFENVQGTHVLVDDRTKKMVDTVEGLRILSLEGLTRQYEHNLQREQMTERQAEAVRQALTEDERITTVVREAFQHWSQTKQWPVGGIFDQLLEGLKMTPHELALAYGLNAELREAELTGQTKEAAVVRGDLSSILLKSKSKVFKRRANLDAIKQARTDSHMQSSGDDQFMQQAA